MKLFVWELRKLWSSSAARGGLVIVGVVLAMALTVTALHEPSELHIPAGAVGRAAVQAMRDSRNAWHFAQHLLTPMVGCLIPAVLLVVLSGTIAGEAERRTLTEPLARGVRRGSLVVAKLAAGLVYALLLAGASAFVALVIAPMVMETGPILPSSAARTATGAPVLLESSVAGWRLCGAYCAALFSLTPVVALAVLVSAASETGRGAAVAGAGIFFSLSTLQAMPGLEGVRSYLFIDHMLLWRRLLRSDIVFERVAFSAGVIVVAFLLLSAAAIIIVSGRELSSGSHSAR